MSWPTEAEYNYWMDILQGKYATPAGKPEWLSRPTVRAARLKPATENGKAEPKQAPVEQVDILATLARIVVAKELIAEDWEYEKAKARAEMTPRRRRFRPGTASERRVH